MQDAARMLKHFVMLDFAMLQPVREAVQRIRTVADEIDMLASDPETQATYFKIRRDIIPHLDLLVACPRELGGFEVLMQLRHHHYYLVRQRVVHGLAAWMDEVADARHYVFEQARLYDAAFRYGPSFTVERDAIEVLAGRVERDEEARALLVEVASVVGISTNVVEMAARSLASYVSAKPDVESLSDTFSGSTKHGRGRMPHSSSSVG